MRWPSLRARTVGVVVVVVTALLAAVPVAHAGPSVRCRSADLRYPFEPGGPKTFGVFRLRITGGSCGTAHRVARAWMADFELDLLLGRVKLPKKAAGFAFTSLPPHAAQTYSERGRRKATTIRFDYVVPNG